MKYIRYLDKGVYQYASVKPVGDVSLLTIDAPDIVTAINMLVAGGVIEPHPDIDAIKTDVGNLIIEVDNTTQLIGEIQAQAFDEKAIQDALVIKEAELRLGLEQTKSDLGLTKADLLQANADMATKVSSLQYEEQYAQLQQELESKAESLNVQTIVDGINLDVANQTAEVETVKTNILNMGQKVDQQKIDLTNSISTSQATTKATTDSITLNVTNLSGVVSGIEGEIDTMSTSISNIDLKADSIQSSVTTLITTTDSQGTRISNAETTIGQHTESINLKANATEVYNKTSIDTALGKKVDTTTYSNKMSAIDISINGINQTVSAVDTEIDNLSGTVTSHTSQISTIDQKADGIALRVSETEGDISGIAGRVSTAETQITANKNDIVLKASQSSVDNLGTRVGTAEGTLTVQAGQIATKVTQTEYDSAVGKNKWIARRYDMNLGASTIVPTFDHIKGKTPVSVIEYADVAILSAFTGDYFMAHYFTNVYMVAPKTVTLSVTNDDGASIFLNGASVYGRGLSATPLNASVSFRAGWNTLEILHYEHASSENVNIRTTIASQVDRMTSVIGVGSKDETRLSQAESSIIQSADAIALKTDSTVTTALGNRVTTAEGALTVQAGQIATKVAQTVFDGYANRMTTAESTIVQQGNSIASKVAQTDFDTLNGKYSTQQTSITQLSNSIATKVEQSTFDALDGKYTTQQSTITQLSDSISTKVAQTDFNTLTGRVTSAETQITTNKNDIILKASQSSLDTLTGRVGTAESSLTVQSGQIATKVTQSQVDTSISNDKKFKDTRSTNENPTYYWTNYKSQNVHEFKTRTIIGVTIGTSTYGGLTTVVPYSDSSGGAITQQFVSSDGVFDRRSTSATTWSAWVKSEDTAGSQKKIDDFNTSVVAPIVTRVSTAESTITQQAGQIALKASQSSMDTLTTRVSSAESSLTVQAGQIATKVTSMDVSNIVDTAKSTNHGYRYYKAITIYGASTSLYYPVIIKGGDQNVKRDIMIKRGYSELAPPDWFNATHKGGLTVKLKTNFGGWGGANYSWEVHELEEMYSNTFGGAVITGNMTMFAIFLRGGGTTGAVYHIYSDQPLDANPYNSSGLIPPSPQVATNEEQIFDYNHTNGTYYKVNAPVPRSYTQAVIDEIAVRNFIKLGQNTNTRITTAESSITQQAGQIALKVSQTDFNNLKVGGTNLLQGTRDMVGKPYKTAEVYNGFAVATASPTTGYIDVFSTSTPVLDDTEYVVSFYAKSTNVTQNIVCHFYNPSTTTNGLSSTGQSSLAVDGGTNVTITNVWKRYWVSWKQSTGGSTKSLIVGRVQSVGNVSIAGVKFEKGNKASDWSPAPEDVESRVSIAESSITQQAGLITTKVEKDGVISSVNQSPEGIKVNANRLDITGIVTFNSMDTATQNKINGIETTANYANDMALLNTDANNYVLNPSFEGKKATGHTNVTALAKADAGVPASSPKPFVGLQTVKENYASEFFAVKTGEVFIVEGWVASTSSVQTFGLGLETNNLVGTSALLLTGHVGKGTGVWQFFQKTYTIPAGVIKARFISQINATSSFGSWYFTDLRITKVVGDDVIANSANWNSANNFVNTWKTPSKTTINGAVIETGSISATQIKTNELIVGQNVQMGTGAVINWNNVTSKPALVSPTDPKLTKIDANGVYTGLVVADNVKGGLLSGVQINVDTDVYVGNALKLGGGIYNTTTTKSIQFNGTDSWIYTNAGSLEFDTSYHLRFMSHSVFLSTIDFSQSTGIDWGNHAPVAKFG